MILSGCLLQAAQNCPFQRSALLDVSLSPVLSLITHSLSPFKLCDPNSLSPHTVACLTHSPTLFFSLSPSQEFNTSGSSNTDTGKAAGNLETKYKVKELGLSFTQKWNTDNTLTTEVSIEDQVSLKPV